MVLIVAITGATGVIYGIRLLELLSANKEVETHLIISQAAELIIQSETDYKIQDIKSLADFVYDNNDIGACLASGSFKRDGMIIAPCTIKTMSALANSYADSLISRAGDVTLKERGKLILLVRETPLHLGHLRNMEKLAEIGAVILPPIPAFYNQPKTIEDIIDHTLGKVLDMLGVDHSISRRWSGLPGGQISSA